MKDIQMDELAKLLLARKEGERIFVNTEGEHYKVWMIYRDELKIITTYGRIGQTMRSTEKESNDGWWIGQQISNIISQKIRKGYKEVK